MADNAGNALGKIIIPYFDPETKQIGPRTWLNMVEMGRNAAGKDAEGRWRWTEEVTCNNAILLLRGKASQWVENLLERKAPELKNWEQFKLTFRKRFIKSLTLTEKLNLMELHMKSTETVLDFIDRCRNNVTLFYEEEWEKLTLDEEVAGLPWGDPGKKVTADHIKVSNNYYAKCIEIHIKMAFASGLKDSIKRQTLIQPSEMLEELLAVAQRVEASQRETQPKREVAITEAQILDLSDEETVEVAATTFKKRNIGPPRRPPPRTTSTNTTNRGRFNGDCFYCMKAGHMKAQCITRRNDRNKGIFKTNINAAPSRRQNAGIEADEEDEETEVAATLNNAQVDVDYLNAYCA